MAVFNLSSLDINPPTANNPSATFRTWSPFKACKTSWSNPPSSKPRVHSLTDYPARRADLGHADVSREIASQHENKSEIRVDTYTTSSCDPPSYVWRLCWNDEAVLVHQMMLWKFKSGDVPTPRQGASNKRRLFLGERRINISLTSAHYVIWRFPANFKMLLCSGAITASPGS